MKLYRWVFGVTVLAGLLVLGTCDLENNASDFGIARPLVWGRTGAEYEMSKPIKAHACCEQLPPRYTNDGGVAWAVNGNSSNWWHTNYSTEPETAKGYDVNTGGTGHVGDTTHYLRKGDADHVDGYTWTKDRALAVLMFGQPLMVDQIADPLNGAQWITLDLGGEVELKAGQIGRLGYLRRNGNGSDADNSGRLGAAGNSYEIYVSPKDFGWLVDEPGIEKVSEPGSRAANRSDMVWLNFTPDINVQFRYIQLRWRFDSSVSGGNAKHATAANIMFKISSTDTELDYRYVTAVYNRAMNLLRTVSVEDRNYLILRKAVVDLLDVMEPPDPASVDTLEKKLAHQDGIDAAADNVLRLIYRIDPPKKPPEIEI